MCARYIRTPVQQRLQDTAASFAQRLGPSFFAFTFPVSFICRGKQGWPKSSLRAGFPSGRFCDSSARLIQRHADPIADMQCRSASRAVVQDCRRRCNRSLGVMLLGAGVEPCVCPTVCCGPAHRRKYHASNSTPASPRKCERAQRGEGGGPPRRKESTVVIHTLAS